MIKTILASLLALSPFAAFAGDGGYVIHACTSDSGRTQINIFADHYSGSAQPFAIRLIIDGQQVEYKSWGNKSDNIIYDWDNGTFAINDGRDEVLSLTMRDESVIIHKGFKDPRAGTDFQYYGDNKRDIYTTCKRYEQGP